MSSNLIIPSLAPIATQKPRDEDELVILCQDPIWRLFNLYYIIDQDGKEVKFMPNYCQQQIIEAYHIHQWNRFVILKSRRIGFSTLIQLLYGDEANFIENLSVAIVDQTQDDAERKLAKIRFAYDSYEPEFKRGRIKDNDSTIELDNGSRITAGKNARGDTFHRLHVSELGPIAYSDPKRAEKIMTGALPAARRGKIFIESTYMGQRVGEFYDIIQAARSIPTDEKTNEDFHFFFFGCFDDPGCSSDAAERIIQKRMERVDKPTAQYFDRLETKLNRAITPRQKVWYITEKQTQKYKMQQEYPATIDEALTSQVKGAIYGIEMRNARNEDRVRVFEWDRAYPVHTAWDLGHSDWTVIWVPI